jgi:arylsulfatase A-like enzyme
VFFCSDNGAVPLGSNGPLSGLKGDLGEGGHRVPAIAYWPGHIRPKVSTQTAMTMDIFPTLAEIAGAAVPPGLEIDGSSMLALLAEGTPMPERTLFWRTGANTPERAARRGPWKLRVTRERTSLHNLDADLAERNDLAMEKPEKVQELKQALAEWEDQFRGVTRLA